LILLALIGLGCWSAGWSVWAEYHYRSAKEALAQRAFSRARAHLKLCLEVWPGNAEVHLLAAQAARRAGDYEEADNHLAACLQLRAVPEARELETALLLAQRGNLASAEPYLLPRLQQESPERPLILEALTRGYLEAMRLPQALHCADQLLKLQPDHRAGLVLAGPRRRVDVCQPGGYRRLHPSYPTGPGF
jgi:predicted Zn-dependent protease